MYKLETKYKRSFLYKKIAKVISKKFHFHIYKETFVETASR